MKDNFDSAMQRVVLVAIVVMMTINSVEAQQMFLKPMVGGTLSTVVGGEYGGKTKMKAGLVAGAEFGYEISGKYGITAGLLYSMQGTKYKKYVDYQKLEYLNIPVLFNYYIFPGFSIKTGPQLGILTRAKIADYEVETLRQVDDFDVKSFCNTIDFSIPVGVSYEFRDFVIDARYNIGITHIGKDENWWHFDISARNRVFMLTLGYKIPLKDY